MLLVLQVADLDAGSYNITAKAVNADGTEASFYSRVQYSITVTALIAACIHCILKLLPVVALLLHSNAD